MSPYEKAVADLARTVVLTNLILTGNGTTPSHMVNMLNALKQRADAVLAFGALPDNLIVRVTNPLSPLDDLLVQQFMVDDDFSEGLPDD